MNKRQLRAMKIAAQQALVNGAAGRELTAEESAQFDTLQREIDALTLEIEAEERQQSQAAGSGQAAAGAAADPIFPTFAVSLRRIRESTSGPAQP